GGGGGGALWTAIGAPHGEGGAGNHHDLVDTDGDRTADHLGGRARHHAELAARHGDHGVHRRVLGQMNGDAVDGEQLHDHRLVVGVVDQLQIVGEAAARGADAPNLAIGGRDRDGGKLNA